MLIFYFTSKVKDFFLLKQHLYRPVGCGLTQMLIYHHKAALLQFYHFSYSLPPQPGGLFLHDQLVPRGHRHPVL